MGKTGLEPARDLPPQGSAYTVLLHPHISVRGFEPPEDAGPKPAACTALLHREDYAPPPTRTENTRDLNPLHLPIVLVEHAS